MASTYHQERYSLFHVPFAIWPVVVATGLVGLGIGALGMFAIDVHRWDIGSMATADAQSVLMVSASDEDVDTSVLEEQLATARSRGAQHEAMLERLWNDARWHEPAQRVYLVEAVKQTRATIENQRQIATQLEQEVLARK